MKFKRILKYRLFKLFFKNYSKLFMSFYKHKLNSNLIDLIKKEVEIKIVYDIGAYRGRAEKSRLVGSKRAKTEEIKVPIKVGDVVLGGKFKNKKVTVKKIGKNEKGDITINDRPLLKYRIPKTDD